MTQALYAHMNNKKKNSASRSNDTSALYAHMNNKRKKKRKIQYPFQEKE
jgi:hypothetical protein